MPVRFLNRLARRRKDPAREIVVGAGVVDEPGRPGRDGASAGRRHGQLVRAARPHAGLPAPLLARLPRASAALAGSEKVSGYARRSRRLLTPSSGRAGTAGGLPAELARLRIELLGGPVRLDENRQALISTSLVRIEPGAGPGGQPRLIPVRTIREVDQSLGGLLSPAFVPSNRPVPCERDTSR